MQEYACNSRWDQNVSKGLRSERSDGKAETWTKREGRRERDNILICMQSCVTNHFAALNTERDVETVQQAKQYLVNEDFGISIQYLF